MRRLPDPVRRLAVLEIRPARRPDPPAAPLLLGGWVPGFDDEISVPPSSTGIAVSEDVEEPSPAFPDPVPIRRQRRGPWGRLAERWVPEPLRDSRIDPGRRGALILGLVAAVAALAAAIGVWRDRPEPRPVTTAAMAPVVAAGSVSGALSSASGLSVPNTKSATNGQDRSGASLPGRSAAEGDAIVVSVTGLVAHPGLVRLKPGTRVADAVAAAGGPTSGADLTGVNLAAKLSDGQSVVIGRGGSPPPSAAGTAPTGSVGRSSHGPVDLNTADANELDALPGVGPVTAANIVGWREKNGRFSSVDQLQEIPGIGPAKFAQIAPLVTV